MKETKKVIIFGTGGNSVDILDTINDINLSLKEKNMNASVSLMIIKII